MLSAVYTLLRAGSEPLAANLCIKASCGWRAAIMGAAGWGLLPVGDAATKGEFRRDVQFQHTAIAADILARHGCFDESSSSYVNAACSVRERWRAACAAAAAAAAQRSGTGSIGAIAAAYERAIFGVLAGSEQHCQASCTSWQDRLWAWGRAVLQSEPEQRLLEDIASTTNDTIPAPYRLRPWQQKFLVSMPSELSGPPNTRKNGDILEQATVCRRPADAGLAFTSLASSISSLWCSMTFLAAHRSTLSCCTARMHLIILVCGIGYSVYDSLSAVTFRIMDAGDAHCA